MTNEPSKQRDFMRELVAEHGPDKQVVCRAYVSGEAAGLVARKQTTKTPEAYADALWRDGLHKGWLKP